MSVHIAEAPAIIHAVPGRVRIHLPEWSGKGQRDLERRIEQFPGIQNVQANSFTHNILIRFDPYLTDGQSILTEVRHLDLTTLDEQEKPVSTPTAIRTQHGDCVRARITVHGMDRDPHLAHRVVNYLQRRPGVKAIANPLTSRVLVEFIQHEVNLEDLISDVANVELPDLPGDDDPAHPLDPGPIIQSATRIIGAGLGLGLLATRQLLSFTEPLPGAGLATQTATVIGILQGIPPFRYGLRRLLGRTGADLLVNIPSIITLTLSGSPLGLVITASESLRLFTEVRARQTLWKRHEEIVAHVPSAQPGDEIHLESGERTPLAANVLEGTGTAIGRDGMPIPVMKGTNLPPGARLFGGPFVLKLEDKVSFQSFTPEPRPAPVAPTVFDRYLRYVGPLSLLYAGLTAVVTRSFNSTLTSLLLVSPRTAAIGVDSADLGASARVIRAGVIVVGTRTNRSIRKPDCLYLDGARLLSDKLELVTVLPANKEGDSSEILAQAAGIAAAAGSPWGGVFRATGNIPATNGSFDGKTATACIEGTRYTLGAVQDWSEVPDATRLRQRGNAVLELRRDGATEPLGLFALRPQLAQGINELVEMCRRYNVDIGVLNYGDQIAVRALAHRADVSLLDYDNAVHAIRSKQAKGKFVAFVSDNAGAAAAFDACDLAIGLNDERSRFPARADLLAPDLTAIAAIVDAGARRNAVVRDSVWLSVASNVIGGIWGLQGVVGLQRALQTVYVTALTTLADGWLRLRGGKRPASVLSHMVDPRPERWGQRSVEQTLHVMHTSEKGLTSTEAEQRQQHIPSPKRSSKLLSALLGEIRSPLIGILAAAAGLSLFLGAIGDVALISFTIVANVAVSVWQEYQANEVTETLKQMGTSNARVLRDGQIVTVPAHQIVTGDILLLASGDRVAADARIIHVEGLEVDEAALTGESLPVGKTVEGGSDISHIVLEGSDITSGSGRAVVVAVGKQTRMGATSAALNSDEIEHSPLSVRLSSLLRLVLPLSLAGGATVIASGLLWGRSLATQISSGATIALAGIPEGLPLLARVGEAGVARRLASRNALVRRLSSVEALGRVDIACTDKTGTLTEGHLALSVVASFDQEANVPGKLPPELRRVLLTAALASPYPDSPDAKAHPTDIAVIQGAERAGLTGEIRSPHVRELSFDPVRSFHATVADNRLCVKGAPEALLPRCTFLSRKGGRQPLDEANHRAIQAYAQSLAGRGLRVLMVAEGSSDNSLQHPQDLTALGFICISDPLRPSVQAAVQRCRAAGVKIIMITGDHPSTARAIAKSAGLLDGHGKILTGAEIAELHNGELDERLEQAVVIARATPLDKLRIIESLQRHGHTVAMTGDGVNDAPALRLADVGVAMGQGGTEVARQTADVVLADDDFATLVETFVEGRSFWRNIRRALALLLGGNLGELGLMVGASVLGLSAPLIARQILAMNAITDILPALAVALQKPEHRNLALLKREGSTALDKPLRNDILRRATATALPSLISFLVMLAAGSLPQARSVAYASVVVTQLAQTLDNGRTENGLTRPVLSAVAGSFTILLATLTIPQLRMFLSLVMPSPLGWALIGGGALVAVLLSRFLAYLSEKGATGQATARLLPPQAQTVAVAHA